jgi:hypothetical protein
MMNEASTAQTVRQGGAREQMDYSYAVLHADHSNLHRGFSGKSGAQYTWQV